MFLDEEIDRLKKQISEISNRIDSNDENIDNMQESIGACEQDLNRCGSTLRNLQLNAKIVKLDEWKTVHSQVDSLIIEILETNAQIYNLKLQLLTDEKQLKESQDLMAILEARRESMGKIIPFRKR